MGTGFPRHDEGGWRRAIFIAKGRGNPALRAAGTDVFLLDRPRFLGCARNDTLAGLWSESRMKVWGAGKTLRDGRLTVLLYQYHDGT